MWALNLKYFHVMGKKTWGENVQWGFSKQAMFKSIRNLIAERKKTKQATGRQAAEAERKTAYEYLLQSSLDKTVLFKY